ncbi:MAG: UTP--glucose-1-phosphate uridylyltransferase [Candidatus Zapsychrus exili]|nr:UTP--glucose-1-phosphate uridylyltransferase [Candidatus Zapsychrus exili]
MMSSIPKSKTSLAYKVLCSFIAFSFVFTAIIPPSYGQSVSLNSTNMPILGQIVPLSNDFTPTIVKGITIHPENPLEFDFIVDSGDNKLKGEQLEEESLKLIKYFLATLTVPEDQLWVNLNPSQPDKIMPEKLGHTEMGRDLLAQDYILKQLTASLMHPEGETGKKFWNKIYKRTKQEFGTTDINTDTLNRVWIVPSSATVYEKDNSAFVLESELKVLLDKEYLSTKEGTALDNSTTTQIIKEIIIPELEREVNTGKNFALLRQISNSMILATWFKMNLKESLLGKVYVDQNKVTGIDLENKNVKQEIYNQYLEAFKTGVYNYIKEEYNSETQEIIPKKYFSGGMNQEFSKVIKTVNENTVDSALLAQAADVAGLTSRVNVNLAESLDEVGILVAKAGSDAAMITEEGEITAATITLEDFQQLVKQRNEGKIGFHKNVDPKKVVPAKVEAVIDWSSLDSNAKKAYVEAEAEMYRDGKIAPIVMIGGEATRFGGPKTFVKVDATLGDFLEIKAANIRWIEKTFGEEVPLYLLSSEKRLAEFKEQLAIEKNYYGMREKTFKFFVQGVIDTFIPTDQEIEANYKKQEWSKFKALASKIRKENPDGIYRFNGKERKVPAGHFDAVASFIISGRFSDALSQGVEYIPVFNIDNLQAVLKNDGMLAHFAKSESDFGFLLAEKNITYTIKHKKSKVAVKAIVRFRDNLISFDGINEYEGFAEKNGVRYVINQKDKTVDVVNIFDGGYIEAEIFSKPETGGTLVEYVDEKEDRTGEVTMKEGFELQPDFDHANAPFFNTNTVILRAKSLLRFLDVTEKELAEMNFEERSELVREKLVKQIKANFEFKKHVVDGEYSDIGIVKDGKTEIPVVQLTRIMLQVAHIDGAKVAYYNAPRKDIFAPVKEPEDTIIAAENNRQSLAKVTSYDQAMMAKKLAPLSTLDKDVIKIGILTGGGLATGHNSLITAAKRQTMELSKKTGKKVVLVGIKSGWAGLVEDNLVEQAEVIDIEEAELHEKKGGSFIGTSRTNPFSTKNIKDGVPEKVRGNVQKLGLDALITCGGDDTNGAAQKLQKMFPDLMVLGVPKTMDNDITLPGGVSTYGYDTFVQEGIRRAKAIKTSAINLGRIMVVEVFGRDAGFTTIGIGEGVGATRSIIPEEGPVDIEKLKVDLAKFYKEHGYGLVVVSEGIKFSLDDIVIPANIEVDSFGHAKLKDAAKTLVNLLEPLGVALDTKISLVGKEDYATREADISDFDYGLTQDLGTAAINELWEKGTNNRILYRTKNGIVRSMTLQKNLGGREVKIEGINKEEYQLANRALFPISNQSVDALPISKKTANLLKGHGIDTVGQLRGHTSRELLAKKDIGQIAVNETKQGLLKYDFKLKRDMTDQAMVAGVLPRVNPAKTDAWEFLEANAARKLDLRKLFNENPERAIKLLKKLNDGFEVDFSKNLIDDTILNALLLLAEESGLKGAIELMFTGAKINETENRAVLHTALRNVKRNEEGKLVAANGPVLVDKEDVMPKVIAVLNKMEGFTKKVQSGQWRGATGKKIKNVINVGIGGSALGPKMAVEALKPYKQGDVNTYFLSNIDGNAVAELMKNLDPEETLVIIASKTFTTQETMQNAQTLRKWVLDSYNKKPLRRFLSKLSPSGSFAERIMNTRLNKLFKNTPIRDKEIIEKHFVAVSTAEKLVKEFGIDTENMFEFWDWVGGRYSVWSAIGLSVSIYAGFDNFLEFLEGARESDEHFRKTEFQDNIPVLKALLNIWYGNFLGAKSFAILPYDENLGLIPSFSQQFFMESNGKFVDRNGNPVDYPTGLAVFGAAGTDGQHSFYQLLHQMIEGGIIPADFIGVINPQNLVEGHHDKFFSNYIAQTEALAFGLTQEEALAELEADPKNKTVDLEWLRMLSQHKTFPGNRPTTSILIDKVTPRALGNLISMYEHQIFAEGVIWNIFSFDQWGVQLGKKVATNKVLPSIIDTSKLETSGLSTSAIKTIRKFDEKFNKDQAMLTEELQEEINMTYLPKAERKLKEIRCAIKSKRLQRNS